MKSRFSKVAVLLAAMSFGIVGTVAAADPTFYFDLVNEVFGYGQDTTTIIIDSPVPVSGGSVSKSTFSVWTKNVLPGFTEAVDGADGINVIYEGARQITDVFVSESNRWNELKPAAYGRYIIIKLEYGKQRVAAGDDASAFPGVAGASTMAYVKLAGSAGQYNYLLDLQYQLNQKSPFTLASGQVIKAGKFVKRGEINPLVEEFDAGVYDGLYYQCYTPKNVTGKLPLVVWLHGSGERTTPFGIQNQNLLRANEEGVAWITPESQAARPAYILLPQSPIPGWTDDAGRQKVKALIDQILATANIDESRVYLAGDSMGGRGTWTMLREYPDLFAAAITAPSGDSYDDPTVLEPIKNIPIWQLNIAGDSLEGTEATYKTMRSINANIRRTHYPTVRDVDTWNQPHWVWVPTLQNIPTTSDQYIVDQNPLDIPGQHILDWLFSQQKKSN
ncbi:phospholipase/carboxylesterase [Spirochaetia bacterium]|nr:phospholipase/carboxylesterase [Spirochaetia bacterium]